MNALSPSQRQTGYREATRAAVVFGFVGLLEIGSIDSIFIEGGFTQEGLPLIIARVIAAIVVGYASWFVVDPLKTDQPVLKGAFAGLIIGILSHFISAPLFILYKGGFDPGAAFIMVIMSMLGMGLEYILIMTFTGTCYSWVRVKSLQLDS